MRYYVEEKKNKFAYIQLYEQIREDIVKGVLSYGTKLPSKRLLAEETDTSVITVEHTYSILCEEGYIESRERSGYFVIYQEKDFWSSGDSAERKSVKNDTISYTQGVKCDFHFLFYPKPCARCWQNIEKRFW